MKFSPYGSTITLVFQDKFHPEILTGSPRVGNVKEEMGGENQLFCSFKRQYVKNGSRYG